MYRPRPFHIAVQVRDLDEARCFHKGALGCSEGLPGEQATLFLLDPSGNALEFKAFKDIEKQLFAT